MNSEFIALWLKKKIGIEAILDCRFNISGNKTNQLHFEKNYSFEIIQIPLQYLTNLNQIWLVLDIHSLNYTDIHLLL